MAPEDVERFLREGGEPAPYLLPPPHIDSDPTAAGHYRARLLGDCVSVSHLVPPVKDEQGKPMTTTFGVYGLLQRSIKRYRDWQEENSGTESTDFPESEL